MLIVLFKLVIARHQSRLNFEASDFTKGHEYKEANAKAENAVLDCKKPCHEVARTCHDLVRTGSSSLVPHNSGAPNEPNQSR